jgi:uncharacterized phage infection (PIP) family protein YhgE
MNDYQQNLTDMFQTVSAYMDNNKTLWNAIPAIQETVAELDAGIAQILSAGQKQRVPTKGAAKDKGQIRRELEDKVELVAGQLHALAAKNGDAVLAGKTDLPLSQLGRLKADALEATAKNIKDLAAANATALAAYGLTAEDMTELDNFITAFHGVKTEPREAIVERKKQTDTLPELIDNVRSLLRNRLDKQMTQFKRKHPEFYAGYLDARVIVDRGSGGRKKPAPATPPPAPPAP